MIDCWAREDPGPLFGPGVDINLWLVHVMFLMFLVYTRGSSGDGGVGDASSVETYRPLGEDRHAKCGG